jgi:hypothetical protein
MPLITNPMDALNSFEVSLKGLVLHRNPVESDLVVHVDKPNGEIRFTHAMLDNELVKGLVNYVQIESYLGLPCFSLGYAVKEKYRGAGLAQLIIKKIVFHKK